LPAAQEAWDKGPAHLGSADLTLVDGRRAASGRLRDGADGGRREVYAALDLGTNNCRLLVACPAGSGFRVVDAYSRIVRLGEGLSATGRLSEAAMARTIKALGACAEKMRQRGVTRARAVATEACRRAANCNLFVARVHGATGIELEIISNSEEASLALHGCAPLLSPERSHALVFDIGGGSTEVSWLEVVPDQTWPSRPAVRPLAWHSVPIGVVTLAEGYGGRDIPAKTYRRMVEEVTAALRPFEAEHGLGGLVARGQVQMLGTSGTVTTLAGVHKRLPRYNRARVDGAHLSFDTISSLSRRLAGMSYEARVEQPCIGPERADLVVAGCAILDAICGIWPVGRLRVADRGLREGILFTMMYQPVAAGRNRYGGTEG
jgi:exopolyphosphatase/guanosine-5'-triphosphate,3'-diphosphate pyrophosphatase